MRSSEADYAAPATADWSKLVVPQRDGYDSGVIQSLASQTGASLRYLRGSDIECTGAKRIFDGAVTVCHFAEPCRHSPGLRNAAPAPTNLLMAESYVSCWPEAFRQFATLMAVVNPVVVHPAMSPNVSSSHSDGDVFGLMYATCHDSAALAECLVHEMAHNKLRAMGVQIESATHLILNDPKELYESPIIKDRRRPMTAVVHAEYAFAHVAALDVHVVRTRRGDRVERRFSDALARNVLRIEQGLAEIERHVRADRDGEDFLSGLAKWVREIATDARALLGP